MRRTPKDWKAGSPRPSKRTPVADEPSETGSFWNRSYGECQQVRHPNGPTVTNVTDILPQEPLPNRKSEVLCRSI